MYYIKNWKEHQPSMKPDRNVIWIKVYRRLLEDYGWNQLSDSNKATLLELWLLASENNGQLPDIEEISFRLRKDVDYIKTQLKQLSTFVKQDVSESETKRKQVVSLEVDVEIEEDKEVDKLTTYTNDFNTFWDMYPKKVGKGKAYDSWKKVKPPLDKCLKSLEWQKKTDQWVRENGQYIPHPATYINQLRFDDEPNEYLTNF